MGTYRSVPQIRCSEIIQNRNDRYRQFLRPEKLAKIIIAVSYFSKRSIIDVWQGSEYVSGSEYPRAVNSPGFWICLWFWMCYSLGYTRVLNMSLILNMLAFWLYQSSEYARVTQGSEYVWIILEYAWLCLALSGYAWISRNMYE